MSINGVIWRCEILRDAAAPFSTVGVLDFPASEALVIEWPDTALEEPINGSAATLTLLSPSDREYIDLYTVKPGAVRLDVYRNNVLYWSGTLDTEFYEEPYDCGRDYEVTLTFSDLGVLDRMPYDLSGVQTFRAIVNAALSKSGVNYTSLDETRISTKFVDDTAVTLSALTIPSDNFFDEDGIAMSYAKVLAGLLQPLALRIVQKAGKFYVYDLNGLISAVSEPSELEWTSIGSSMGMAQVYNNVKVTFSPYSRNDVQTGALDYGDLYGPEWSNLTSNTNGVKYNGGNVPSGMSAPICYSWYPDYSTDHREGGGWDYNLVSFTAFLSMDGTKCKGVIRGADNYFFHIQPVLGGSEESGVVGGFYTGGHGSMESGWPVRVGVSPAYHTADYLAMKTERIYLPKLSDADRAQNYVKVGLDLMFDPRYNPFESESAHNEKDNAELVKSYANISLVPVAVVMYDASGSALCHWDNSDIVQNARPGDSVKANAGGWVSGEASFGDAWLAFYDPENMDDMQGKLGWQSNRQCFGVPVFLGSIMAQGFAFLKDGVKQPWWAFDSFRQAPDGQFIPYPPQGGYMEVRIYNGVWAFRMGDGFSQDLSTSSFNAREGFSKIRWQLYKAPSVSLVKNTLTFDVAQADDIEYNGLLNADAKEHLELDTVVGTVPSATPTAKGVMMRASTGEMLGLLKRAGVTDHPEQLLIGTLYSQYAERKIVLSGETALIPSGVTLASDAAQPSGRVFLFRAEAQDPISDTSEITAVEVSEDTYEGIA